MTTCKLCLNDAIIFGNYCRPCINSIVTRAKSGESMRFIADDLGISRNAVIGLWNRHKPEGFKHPGASMKSVETRKENQKVAEHMMEQYALSQPVSHATGPKDPVGCRWIDGDPKSGDWHFCQRKRDKPSYYCEFHRPMTVKPIDAIKRKFVRKPTTGKHFRGYA